MGPSLGYSDTSSSNRYSRLVLRGSNAGRYLRQCIVERGKCIVAELRARLLQLIDQRDQSMIERAHLTHGDQAQDKVEDETKGSVEEMANSKEWLQQVQQRSHL